MISSRRGFLFGAAAVALAPAIVRASNLMPISVLKPPRLWGDGIHDDTEALQHLIDKEFDQAAANGGGLVAMPAGVFRITDTLKFAPPSYTIFNGGGARVIVDGSAEKPIRTGMRISGREGVATTNIEIRNFYFECRNTSYGIEILNTREVPELPASDDFIINIAPPT